MKERNRIEEALGRMLSVLGLELAKLTDVKSSLLLWIWFILIQQRNQGRKTFAQKPLLYLEQVLPVMLRFMADDYDDTASTIFPFLQVVLTKVSSSFVPVHMCDRAMSSTSVIENRPKNLSVRADALS